jgi:hypothetical protein
MRERQTGGHDRTSSIHVTNASPGVHEPIGNVRQLVYLRHDDVDQRHAIHRLTAASPWASSQQSLMCCCIEDQERCHRHELLKLIRGRKV